MTQNGNGQRTVKIIPTAASQAQLRRFVKQRRGRKPPNEQYAPNRHAHTSDEIKLRPQSRCLIEPDNEEALLEGFCKFTNMSSDAAHMMLVAAILSGNDGYSFIQSELGISIPDPDNLFDKLVRELIHQFRVLNNASSFFKEAYAFPRQKDHPINIAHRELCIGDDSESIYTKCTQVLVTSACRCFIASKDAESIGRVWHLLMSKKNQPAKKAANHGFGGLRLLFNAANYEDDESRYICDWLVKANLVPQIFNLFRAMLAEEKSEIAGNLERDPSFYHRSSNNPIAAAAVPGHPVVDEEEVVEANTVAPAVVTKPKGITRRSICMNADVFQKLCDTYTSVADAGFDHQALVTQQDDVKDYITKSTVVGQLSGLPAIFEHRTEIQAFYSAGDNLEKAGIDPMTVSKNGNILTAFFDAVNAVSELGFDIPAVLQKVPVIKKALAAADEEL